MRSGWTRGELLDTVKAGFLENTMNNFVVASLGIATYKSNRCIEVQAQRQFDPSCYPTAYPLWNGFLTAITFLLPGVLVVGFAGRSGR